MAKLTRIEARAAAMALDNCLGDNQDCEAVFGTPALIRAAERASRKLWVIGNGEDDDAEE